MKDYLKTALDEVNTTLLSHANSAKKSDGFDLQKYIGTGKKVIGLDAKLQHALCKKGYSFSSLPYQDQLKIWNYIWQKAQLFETQSQVLLFANRYYKKMPANLLWKVTQTWTRVIDNWAHSDALSGLYNRLFLAQAFTQTQLNVWNTSSLPWERRQSMVIMAVHFRHDALVSFPIFSKWVKRLLNDEDYFVQKGIGWALREAHKPYSVQTEKFIISNVLLLSSPAFATATEKWDKENKQTLILKRRNRK
jgi:3-methyladenine DNA glycosylase AlkD